MGGDRGLYVNTAMFFFLLRVICGRHWDLRCTNAGAHVHFSEEYLNFLGEGRWKGRSLNRRSNPVERPDLGLCAARLEHRPRRHAFFGTVRWRDCILPPTKYAHDFSSGQSAATYSVAHFESPRRLAIVDVVCKCLSDNGPCEGRMIFPNSRSQTAPARLAASLDSAELVNMLPEPVTDRSQVLQNVVTQAEAVMESLLRVDLLDVIFEKPNDNPILMNGSSTVGPSLLDGRLLFQTQLIGRPGQFTFPRECVLQFGRNPAFRVSVIERGCAKSDKWDLRIDGHERSKTRAIGNDGDEAASPFSGRPLRVNRLLFSFSLSGLTEVVPGLSNRLTTAAATGDSGSLEDKPLGSPFSAQCTLDFYRGLPRLEKICGDPRSEPVNAPALGQTSRVRKGNSISENAEVERILRSVLDNATETLPMGGSLAGEMMAEMSEHTSVIETPRPPVTLPLSEDKNVPRKRKRRGWQRVPPSSQSRRSSCVAEGLADRQIAGCRYAAVVKCSEGKPTEGAQGTSILSDDAHYALDEMVARIMRERKIPLHRAAREPGGTYCPEKSENDAEASLWYRGRREANPTLPPVSDAWANQLKMEEAVASGRQMRLLRPQRSRNGGGCALNLQSSRKARAEAERSQVRLLSAFGSQLKGWSKLKFDSKNGGVTATTTAATTRAPFLSFPSSQVKFQFSDRVTAPDVDAILAKKQAEDAAGSTQRDGEVVAGPLRRPNRGILGLGIGKDVPNSRASIFRAVNLVSYGPWMVEWGRDRIERATQVQVGNDFGFVSEAVGVVQRETAFSTGWKRMVATVSYNEIRQELGLGVAVGPYGVNVDRSQVLRATAVEVLARGVEAGTLVDFTDRNFGQRIKVRNFEISVRHDFDDFLLASDIGFGTEVLVGFRGFSTAVVFDLREARVGVSVGLRNYNFAVLHDFDGFLTEAQANWGRGWQLALESDFPDEFSTAIFLGVGFGRLNRVFSQVGAGIGEEGFPQASAKIQTRNVGLGVDLLEEFGQRLFQFALTVGKFTYVWQCNFVPDNILIPNIFGVPPHRVNEFLLSLIPKAPPPIRIAA